MRQPKAGSRKPRAGSIATATALVAALGALPTAAQAQYPTRPPAPTALRPVRFPPFVTTRLANGMDLVVVEQHKQPVVTVTLAVQAGAIHEPADKVGLSGMVAELLTKGTESRTADQISAEVEGAGGSVFAGSDNDFTRVSVSSLSEHLPLALSVIADVVTHSTFPAAELELARTRMLSALRVELSQPASIADRIFRREVYGAHPSGRSATPASQQAMLVKAVTRPPGGKITDLLKVNGKLDEPFWDLDQPIARKVAGSPTKKASFGAFWVDAGKGKADSLYVAVKVTDGPAGKTPLTPEALKAASADRHVAVKMQMGPPPGDAAEDYACRMEHVVDAEVMRRLSLFAEFLRQHPHTSKDWAAQVRRCIPEDTRPQ
jgi:hypothetical protein